jgi:hypothetical protein
MREGLGAGDAHGKRDGGRAARSAYAPGGALGEPAPPPTANVMDGLVMLNHFVLGQTGKALPFGWRALLQRDAVCDAMQTGDFICPEGRRFRTMQSVAQHVGQQSAPDALPRAVPGDDHAASRRAADEPPAQPQSAAMEPALSVDPSIPTEPAISQWFRLAWEAAAASEAPLGMQRAAPSAVRDAEGSGVHDQRVAGAAGDILARVITPPPQLLSDVRKPSLEQWFRLAWAAFESGEDTDLTLPPTEDTMLRYNRHDHEARHASFRRRGPQYERDKEGLFGKHAIRLHAALVTLCECGSLVAVSRLFVAQPNGTIPARGIGCLQCGPSFRPGAHVEQQRRIAELLLQGERLLMYRPSSQQDFVLVLCNAALVRRVVQDVLERVQLVATRARPEKTTQKAIKKTHATKKGVRVRGLPPPQQQQQPPPPPPLLPQPPPLRAAPLDLAAVPATVSPDDIVWGVYAAGQEVCE